jgi:hypothetical protein
MNELSISLIEGAAYILLILVAVRHSWKKGEAEGSTYMLSYLRDNKYKNTEGIKVPYLDDTGFNNFMKHVREEDGKKKKV